jgi:hypothetical protein
MESERIGRGRARCAGAFASIMSQTNGHSAGIALKLREALPHQAR